MSFIENLIFSVKRRPELWDPADCTPSNKDRIQAAWDEVAAEVGPTNFVSKFGETDCEMLKRNWLVLRDYYKSEIKREKSQRGGNTSSSHESSWPYFAAMSFLDNNDARTKTQNVPDNVVDDPSEEPVIIDPVDPIKIDENDSDEVEIIDNHVEKEKPVKKVINVPAESNNVASAEIPLEVSLTVNDAITINTDQPKPKKPRKRTSRKKSTAANDNIPQYSMPNQNIDFSIQNPLLAGFSIPGFPPQMNCVSNTRKRGGGMQNNMSNPCILGPDFNEGDPDFLFMKSLLPDLKALPQLRKMLVKLKFQEILFNEVVENTPGGPVTT